MGIYVGVLVHCKCMASQTLKIGVGSLHCTLSEQNDLGCLCCGQNGTKSLKNEDQIRLLFWVCCNMLQYFSITSYYIYILYIYIIYIYTYNYITM